MAWDTRIAVLYFLLFFSFTVFMIFGDTGAVLFGILVSMFAVPVLGLIYCISLRFSIAGIATLLASCWILPDTLKIFSSVNWDFIVWITWGILPLFYLLQITKRGFYFWNFIHLLLSFVPLYFAYSPENGISRMIYAVPLLFLVADIRRNEKLYTSLPGEKRFKLMQAVSLSIITLTDFAHWWVK